ncbi:choice-of-anchor A family protein [Uliginosibacterium sp. H1]|uniref:choice-of-anchor A family protein n=1 Tax=Uliginosibacterium sp. H1 TaxID=3114757 RepID=UPI002E18CDAC|nr:choice-of-anchor A family protein [Uliginosibacterium sp. H1]
MQFNKRGLVAAMLALAAGSAHAVVVDLGVAGQFNAFIYNDLTVQNWTHAEGAVAVGGNANIGAGWGGATHDSATVNGQQWGLVVGGNLSVAGSGQISQGKTYVGGSLNPNPLPNNFNTAGGLQHGGAAPIDFAAVQSQLTTLSGTLQAEAATGSVQTAGSRTRLMGTGGAFEVFNLDGDLLTNAAEFELYNIAAGATLVLNIGAGADKALSYVGWDWSNFFVGNTGVKKDWNTVSTLVNFYDAENLFFQSNGLHFNILAPNAQVGGQWGHIEGTVVAESWNAATELRVGTPPFYSSSSSSGGSVPAPAPLLLVGAALCALGLARRR